jgi:hypothetical protein
MIRRAVPSDIQAIVELGIEALNKGAYKNMVVSRTKVEEMARLCVASPANFAFVAERDGVVGGAVCGFVNECLFYERKQLSIVQFYCRIPGEGIKLIREVLRWARGRPAIKLIVFSMEHDADPRIGLLLKRLGLWMALPTFIETR